MSRVWLMSMLAIGSTALKAPRSRTVCVTGASGFVAAAVIEELQRTSAPDGLAYSVVGTVRSVEKWRGYPLFIDVDLYEADLMDGPSFSAAFKRCSAVIHTASPFWLDFKPKMIATAVEGTQNVLQAAKIAGISKVIVTSSCAAVTPQDTATVHPTAGPGEAFTEWDWNRDSTEEKGPYRLSKRLSEEELWRFAAKEGKGGHYVAINPAFVLGPPALQRVSGESITFMKRLLEGEFAADGAPAMAFGVVDVRDVARAHVRALDVPEANGKRFILSSQRAFSTLELSDMVKAHKDYFKRFALPTSLSAALPPRVRYSNDRARDVLNVTLRPTEKTVTQMADFMLGIGMIDTQLARRRMIELVSAETRTRAQEL